jgi:Na+:H+ antiporter
MTLSGAALECRRTKRFPLSGIGGWLMNTHFAIEYLILVLIAASLIAVVAARLRIPYTGALVLGGLALGSFHLPIWDEFLAHRPDWLTPDVALVIFLPALLFEGSLKMQVRHLRENLAPILLLASAGVLVTTLFTGFAVHWAFGLPPLVALVFGSVVAATDPISVLAIFKDMAVAKRLAVIVEGESLFNDGTAAKMLDATDRELDKFREEGENAAAAQEESKKSDEAWCDLRQASGQLL